MLSPTALSRPSASTCLRCQLRQVLLDNRSRPIRSPPPFRTLSSSTSRFDALDEAVVRRSTTPYAWKHSQLQERVIGGPGKRQRVVSERLAADSLKQPSNIIVFSDVKEAPDTPIQFPAEDTEKRQPQPRALSAEDVKSIEDAVFGRELVPGEAEVNSSIDSLRPENPVVDKVGYERHQKSLSRGYTSQQLSTYLASSLQSAAQFSSASASNDTSIWKVSEWRSGSTPLSKRHAVIVRSTSASTKGKVIERILRLVWQLTTESEDHAVGELEIQLEPWQMSMLFDLTHDGRPYYERLVPSKVLLESIKAEAWTPDNILRITARRHNAQEVAHQLKAILLSIQPLELHLRPYLPLLSQENTALLPDELIRDEDIRFVSDITKCVIAQNKSHVMTIYGSSPSRSYSARRLLLSLLEIQCPISFRGTLDIDEMGLGAVGESERHDVPVPSHAPGLHRRHLALNLYRNTAVLREKRQNAQPQQALSSKTDSHTTIQTAEALAKMLKSIRDPYQYNRSIVDPAATYWRGEARVNHWNLEFCRLLHIPGRNSAKVSEPRSTLGNGVVQSQVSGAETLLTYFEVPELPRPLNSSKSGRQREPASTKSSISYFDRRIPYLISHFVPAPSALEMNARLPRIEMRFRFSAPELSGQPRELKLVGLKAILDEQHLHVLTPQCSVDLCFSRDVSVVSNIATATQDGAIHEFWVNLQESVQSGQGALVAPPSLTFKMPQWMLGNQTTAEQSAQANQDVEYLFERFQQVQDLHFTPSQEDQVLQELGPEARALIEAFPKHHYLTYKEIEGGAIHGSQTTLGLRRLLPTSSESGTSDQESVLESPNPTEKLESHPSITAKGGGDETAATETPGASDETASDPELQFTTVALRIARLLTLSSAGTLRASQVTK